MIKNIKHIFKAVDRVEHSGLEIHEFQRTMVSFSHKQPRFVSRVGKFPSGSDFCKKGIKKVSISSEHSQDPLLHSHI